MRKILFLALALAMLSGSAMAVDAYMRFDAPTCGGGAQSGIFLDGIGTTYPPQDHTVTINFKTDDLLAESTNGWWGFGIWGGSDIAAGDYIEWQTDATADPGLITVDNGAGLNQISVAAGFISMRIVRTGLDMVTEYSTPGSNPPVWNTLNTATMTAGEAATDADVGFMFWTFSGPAGACNLETYEVWSITLEDTSGTQTWDPSNLPPASSDGNGAWGDFTPVAVPAAPATVSIQQNAPSPFDTLPSGTASWSVTFSEDVTGVAAGQFTAVLGGNAAAPDSPVLTGSSPDFVISFANVTGNAGQIGVDFTPAGAVLTTAGGEAVLSASGAAYSSIPPAPAAKGWVLVFMGLMLALATVVTLRKKAVNH